MLTVNIMTCRNAPRKWGQMTSHSSWPGLSRPSTSYLEHARKKTWMPGTRPGMTAGPLTIFPQPALAEHVDRALLDGQVGGAGGGLDPERHHQRPRRAAMGDRDGIHREPIIPVPHPDLHRGIAFAVWRSHRPFVGLAPGKKLGVRGLHLRQGRAFPTAVTDLAQPIVDRIIERRQPQDPAHQLHGRARAAKRACDE